MGQGEMLTRAQQFRISYDQNGQSPYNKNRATNDSHHDLDLSKHGMDQMRLEEPHENQAQHLIMPRGQSIDGLNQLHGVDNMAALNNLLQQQQQQQQQQPSRSNTSNHATAFSLASTQSLEQQLAALQQQLHQEPQNNQPHSQEPQQMETMSLHENLLQLQKLQEQQHQILKNISQNTGLVDPNSLMNPLGTLLNTLMGQINGNNSNDTGNDNINNSNDMSNPMNHDANSNNALAAWGQMGGRQELQLPNNSLQNAAGTMSTMLPQQDHQRKRTSFVETNNAPLEAPRPMRLPPASIRSKEQRKRYVSDPSLTNAISRRNSSRSSSRESSPHTNINIEFPTPPIIRKNEGKKKERPKSFPSQLWDAMMTNSPKNDEAFEWLPDGKSFVVVNPEMFCKEILDRKFKQSKYGSFVRKLHRWGFIRLTSGTGTDCFHHPLFQKLRPELLSQIKCNSRKEGGKKGHNAYARGEYQDTVQPSLMGVEKFIRTKVVSTEDAEDADDFEL